MRVELALCCFEGFSNGIGVYVIYTQFGDARNLDTPEPASARVAIM